MRSSMSAGVTEYLGAIDTKFVSGTNLCGARPIIVLYSVDKLVKMPCL